MNGNTTKGSAETQLQVAIGVILKTLSDKSLVVKDTSRASLMKLASKHPEQVLNSCCLFCDKEKTDRPTSEHVAVILRLMEEICNEYVQQLNSTTREATINFALNIMIDNTQYEVVQGPASGVLVALGRNMEKDNLSEWVVNSLVEKLAPDQKLHYMVLNTLGTLFNVNALGFVPIPEKILEYLNTLGIARVVVAKGPKQENLKQAYAYALGSFSDALTEYVLRSNKNDSDEHTINISDFHADLDMSYDILATNLLQSRETKVVESVLLAISSIFPNLSTDKITEHTSKLVVTLLSLYKKSIDAYYVTKCLEAVIRKVTSVNGMLLEPYLYNILSHLADLVCISPDYAQPDLLRTHSEVLRCYERLMLHFTDHTIDQLIGQLKNNNDREKVKAITIITHLISYSSDQSFEQRLKDVMHHLGDLIFDPNILVKNALMKVTVVLASRGILLNKEINPDGPEKYMELILKLCRTQAKSNDITVQEAYDLQKSAENTLFMLSSSVQDLETTLWTLLLARFTGLEYEDAVIILLKCLTKIASKNPDKYCCKEVFIRCLTLLALPLPDFRGTYVLNFLKTIKPCEKESYKDVWDTKIPQLVNYLEQNYDHFNEVEWKDLIFDFLNLLLQTISDEDTVNVFVQTAKKHLLMYNFRETTQGLSYLFTEKQFLLKCLGILLCNSNDFDMVLKTLNHIISNVKLSDYTELNACAEAIGICSRTHLKIVLEKLQVIRKDVLGKKASKFLTLRFIKEPKQDIEVDRLRYVVILSYAEICNEAPTDQLISVLESEILSFIITELNNCKDFATRKVCLKAILSVSETMHTSRNKLLVRMQHRDELIQIVSSQMHLHNGPEYIELFPTIIPVLTSLVKLHPNLETDQRLKLLKLCFDNVFNGSSIYCKISNNNNNNENYYGTLKLVTFITQSFTKLNQLVQELLLLNMSPSTLDEIVTLLEGWICKKKPEQRLPACETLRIVLQTYLDNMMFAFDCPNSFNQTGFLLSRIVPRCTDPNNNIRKTSVDSLCLVLCISSRYEGHMRDHDKILSTAMQHIQQQIESEDPKLLYNLTADVSHLICTNIPQYQLIHFIDGLIEALLDCEPSSSNGSSVVLSLTLKAKGTELQSHAHIILNKILNSINKIQCPRTRTSALKSVLNLGGHHPKTVGNILLSQTLPFEQSICDCWSMLSTDQTLTQDLLDQFKKILKQTPLYEEQGSPDKKIKILALQPLQVISAIHEILKNPQLREICQLQFPELFSLLLVTLFSYIGSEAPAGDRREKHFTINRDEYRLQPVKVALDTFRVFLVCCDYSMMASTLVSADVDNSESYESYLKLVSNLVELICEEHPQHRSWLVACLGPYIRSDFEPQRVAAVAFFTYLLRHKANDQAVLSENLLEMIMDVQSDQSCIVKQIALEGLGYAIESLNNDLISRHCNQVLSVLMSSLDYSNINNEKAVVLEGLLSFSKLLSTLDGFKFSSCQVTAAVRIKPLLTQEDVKLRGAAFKLLGDLTASLGSDANLEAFKEQIQGNLVTLLLHLCDSQVVRPCKYTLRKVAPYLDCPKVNQMIQERLIDEANLNYEVFIKSLIQNMEEEMQELFPLLLMTCVTYFKSSCPLIRSNAALMVGLFYTHLSDDNKESISSDVISDSVIRLSSDDSEEVRIKAVQALACLFLK